MDKLAVITKTKNLMEYILTITKKSDVKYRFTFVNKMHNLCMEIIENLYSANFTRLGNEKRNEYQVNAQAKLHYLDFVCEMAKNSKMFEDASIIIYSKKYFRVYQFIIWMDEK